MYPTTMPCISNHHQHLPILILLTTLTLLLHLAIPISAALYFTKDTYIINTQRLRVMGTVFVEGNVYGTDFGNHVPSHVSKQYSPSQDEFENGDGGDPDQDQDQGGDPQFPIDPDNNPVTPPSDYLQSVKNMIEALHPTVSTRHKTLGNPGGPRSYLHLYCDYSSHTAHVFCHSIDFFHAFDMKTLQWKNLLSNGNLPQYQKGIMNVLEDNNGRQYVYVSHGKGLDGTYNPSKMYRIDVYSALTMASGWQELNFGAAEVPDARELAMHAWDPERRLWVWFSGTNDEMGGPVGYTDFWAFSPDKEPEFAWVRKEVLYDSQFAGSSAYYNGMLLMYAGKQDHLDEEGYPVNNDYYTQIRLLSYHDGQPVQIQDMGYCTACDSISAHVLWPFQQSLPYTRPAFVVFGGDGNMNVNANVYSNTENGGSWNPSFIPSGYNSTSGCMINAYTGVYYDATFGQMYQVAL